MRFQNCEQCKKQVRKTRKKGKKRVEIGRIVIQQMYPHWINIDDFLLL